MVSSFVEKEVQSLINTLGFLEKGTYFLEPDCFRECCCIRCFQENPENLLFMHISRLD